MGEHEQHTGPNEKVTNEPSDARADVRRAYGRLAAQLGAGRIAGGCGPSPMGTGCWAGQVYDTNQLSSMPAEVTQFALGCGNPVELAELKPGQTVLDLGAGGCIDCFLAAQQVGPTGRVIGVEMTSDMLERARASRLEVGTQNVEFRLGEIEHLPVADETADVIISNCVINLSPDKPQVFREAYRALKPGGTLAVTDMMTDGPLPRAVRDSISAWLGGQPAPIEEKDHVAAIEAAGFVDVEVTRRYPEVPDVYLSKEDLTRLGIDARSGLRPHAVLKVAETGEALAVVEFDRRDSGSSTRSFSGKVRARKPHKTGGART